MQGAIRIGPPLLPPADDPAYDHGRVGGTTWIRVAASTGGIVAAAKQTWSARPRPAGGADAGTRVVDRVAVYRSDADTLPDPSPVVEAVSVTAALGFDRLLTS
jgi:hypothetical protein